MATITQTELLKKKIEAVGQSDLSQKIEKARAYYENTQYPAYGNWPYNERNEQVYPKIIVPLPGIIANKSATFLMKKRPRFYVKDSQEATDFISRVIDENQIDLLSTAETGGVEGGVWFKFYTSEDPRRRWRVNTLSVDECIPIYNPHDVNDLWAVRIQYKYPDTNGVIYIHREDWTLTEWITYVDIPEGILDEVGANQPAREGDLANEDSEWPWRKATVQQNQFGVIPLHLVKNLIRPLSPNGEGDYWDLFSVFDRINVAYDNMDVSNQYGGGPVAIFKETDDAPKELAPHEVYSITGPNADVQLLEHQGSLRAHMEWYAEKLETFAYSRSGIVNPKLEDVAGLGQLSYAALQMLHGPLIELTDKKREYWAERGLCLFFEKMLYAASRYGDKGNVPGGDTAVVTAEWPEYFPLGGVDKQIELGNVRAARELGMPIEDTVKWLAKIVGITESELPEFLSRAAADAEAREKLNEALVLLKGMSTGGQEGNAPGNAKPGLQNQAADGGVKGAARKKK